MKLSFGITVCSFKLVVPQEYTGKVEKSKY
jgi:hypothetical protein